MQNFDSKIRKINNDASKSEKDRDDLLFELVEKILSFTPDELDEFIRLASQELNRPLV